jgi:glutamate formiminotransferase/formiminotetrahydrofolate cyclodeaminase
LKKSIETEKTSVVFDLEVRSMESRQLIECVPNFSEGRDMAIIKQITDEIESVEGVQLLDVDPGRDTNRTVVTFVGEPGPVIEAAFLAIRKAAEVIDMGKHEGAHPRMGATDVCPLIPIANVTMEDVVRYAHMLGEKAGKELDIPFYLYEHAATTPARRNLADVRAGEYEALPEKLKQPEWKPDYGPTRFNARAGATAIGARDFLIAYNVNLNTTSLRRANAVAFDVRERGRIKREGDPLTGRVVRDSEGNPVRIPGSCKGVKAIGWYLEEFSIAQVSMNLTDLKATPLHAAFEACRQSAARRGLRVTGSELVGMVPLRVMLEAGRYFLHQQQRSTGIPEEAIIDIAVKSLGLNELAPFDPSRKIIEYRLRDPEAAPLQRMSLRGFAQDVAADRPIPGGGSVAAYVGALGAALGTMVANLSAHKRGWDDRWETFSKVAERGQFLQDDLLRLVDEDALAFSTILEALRLPKTTEEEQAVRYAAVQEATRKAVEVPMRVMELAYQSFDVLEEMALEGLPSAATDAGTGALCARAAVRAAFLQIRVNTDSLEDKTYAATVLGKGQELMEKAEKREREMLEVVEGKI